MAKQRMSEGGKGVRKSAHLPRVDAIIAEKLGMKKDKWQQIKNVMAAAHFEEEAEFFEAWSRQAEWDENHIRKEFTWSEKFTMAEFFFEQETRKANERMLSGDNTPRANSPKGGKRAKDIVAERLGWVET